MSEPGSRPLPSAALSTPGLAGTPLGYPLVAHCHGGSAGLDLQDRPLHGIQQLDGVDVGVANSKSWVWAWVWVAAELVRAPCPLTMVTPGPALPLCPVRGGASFPACGGWLGACSHGQLSRTHTTRANFPALPLARGRASVPESRSQQLVGTGLLLSYPRWGGAYLLC